MEKIRVLLVDDEPDFLEIMGGVIKGWGCDLSVALGGKEAIGILKSAKPDIIILDYLMPGMDGVDTLKAIRNIDEKMPVIMFTAHPDARALKGAEELRVSAFIPKLSTYSNVASSLRSVVEMIARSIGKNG